MSSGTSLRTAILWVTLGATLVAMLGAYRFYSTAPELRFPETEAKWQLVPFVLLALVVVAQLLPRRPYSKPASNVAGKKGSAAAHDS